jgi:large subunit ribosomal protein L22
MAETKMQHATVAKASLNSMRVSPRKARLVADLIRGKNVGVALALLSACNQKTAPVMRKVLLSAVANAKESDGIDIAELKIHAAWVDEGKKLKRFMPRAQGRATPIRKRSSRLHVELSVM